MPKRDFVEENPYLVYSGDSAVSYGSDSGSGNAVTPGMMVSFYYDYSDSKWKASIPFEDALKLIKDKFGFIAYGVDINIGESSISSNGTPLYYYFLYNTSNPDEITIVFNSASGLIWTADGLEYYD